MQTAAEKHPDRVDTELTAAMGTASDVISQAIPEGEQHKWLQELENLKSDQHNTGNNAADKASAGQQAGIDNVWSSDINCRCDSMQPGEDGVMCIHGCERRFCSATCRKKQAREHRTVCDALVRKALLKKIGLMRDPELF